MFSKFFSCFGDSKEKRRVSHVSRFQKRRNSLRGNFVTKYVTPIEDDYTMDEKTLGKGSFGVVVKAYKNSNSRAFAVKFISKVGYLQRIEREIKLLTDLDHANIIRLFSVYDSDSQVAFVLDLCTGGDLIDVVSRYPKKFLNEEFAKVIIRQLVSAVAHIHSRGICHRDIKMQNILLENLDSNHAQIKLIDFGFATRYVGVTPMKTRCGTPYSTAPEVFRECYDERCDVWSVGVVSYFLLSGQRPFVPVVLPGELKKAGRASIVTSILMGRYHFNHPAFRVVSAEGIAFIQRLLTPKYTNRCHAIDAVNCPWLSDKFVKTSKVDLNTLKQKDTPLSLAVSNLRQKSQTSILGNTGMVAVAFDHSRYDAPEVRNLFQYFDKENAGFLSKKTFKKAMKSVSPDLSAEEIDSLFEAIDIDNDKQISFTEFLAATMDPREIDTEELCKAFELLDSNNKGYLTVDDFYRVLAVNSNRETKLELTKTVEKVKDKDKDDSSGDGVSSSGIPYFEETSSSGSEKLQLLKKIAAMIDTADVNKDGVLSYSEFLLGILGFGSVEPEEEVLPPPDQKHLIEKEKERLQMLLDSPQQEERKSFFPRRFSGSHKVVMSPQDVPEPPISSPPTLSPKPKSKFSLSMGKLRSPKTVPEGMNKTEHVSIPDDLNNALPAAKEPTPGESMVQLGGVSGYLEALPSDRVNEGENYHVGSEQDSYDPKDQKSAPEPVIPKHDQISIKGPPAWLIPSPINTSATVVLGGDSSNNPPQKKVVRLPPIV